MNSNLKILIVRTDRIGDVVLSLPLAQLIKQNYSNSKVSYFLRKYTSSLLDGNPFIDEVIIAEETSGQINFLSNLQKIKSKSFDACIVVNPTLKIALMMFLAGIKKRIGTGYRWYSVLFNEKVFEHRKYGEKHELEYNLNLLKQIEINVKGFPDKIDFQLSVDEKSDGRINEILTSNGFTKENKLAIIHPGSGGSSVDLPTEKLIDLTRRINELNNVKIVITGSKNEIELCKKFDVGSSIINLAGSLDVSLLKALIKNADIFISNSQLPSPSATHVAR